MPSSPGKYPARPSADSVAIVLQPLFITGLAARARARREIKGGFLELVAASKRRGRGRAWPKGFERGRREGNRAVFGEDAGGRRELRGVTESRRRASAGRAFS